MCVYNSFPSIIKRDFQIENWLKDMNKQYKKKPTKS